MCGIIASVQLGDRRHRTDSNDVEQQLKAGLAKIAHRGPDASGIWLDPGDRCGLAHCRLSINDLSPTGSQPLHSPDKTIHAIVNGEIYDDGSLRNDLSETYDFTGNSDSELVLALYAKHGLGFLSHLRGEYALCLYDSKRDLFVAARDRYGIKPLFWRRDEKGSIWLGAEIKAFLGPGWQPEWDVDAMADGGWGQDTRTLFKWVNKLRPGHYMTVLKGGEPEIRSYWDLSYPSKDLKDTRTEDEMVTGLRNHLLDSVRLRLRADVPVGIYLSGGIDSSALAGIANHLVKEEGLSMGSQDPMERVCCFSIGFDEESGFDESDIAQRTADWLGVKYVKAHMSESELAARFEDATYHIEHHNHDLNFVGKFALSEVPREHGYKVVLTGEGADENLGGYPLFLPDFLRQPDSSCDLGPTVASDERAHLVEKYEGVVKESYEMIGASAASFDRKEKRGLLAGLSTPAAMSSFNPSLKTFALGASIPDDPLDVIASNVTPRVRSLMENQWHPLNSAMYVWSKGHLVNQFLSCLGDRTEMAHSVEARTPFLDHHLTEYMNNLPPSMKIRWTRAPKPLANAMSATDSKFDEVEDVFVEKYALREAVRPFVTPEVYARRKHPYTAPTEYPSGGPMHRTLQQLVTRENLSQLGFVDCDQAEEFLRLAFDTERGLSVAEKQFAWRQVLIVAEWIVLSQRFGVKRAEPGFRPRVDRVVGVRHFYQLYEP